MIHWAVVARPVPIFPLSWSQLNDRNGHVLCHICHVLMSRFSLWSLSLHICGNTGCVVLSTCLYFNSMHISLGKSSLINLSWISKHCRVKQNYGQFCSKLQLYWKKKLGFQRGRLIVIGSNPDPPKRCWKSLHSKMEDQEPINVRLKKVGSLCASSTGAKIQLNDSKHGMGNVEF